MKKWLGVFLLVSGLTIGLYHLFEWHTATSSAQTITEAELQTIQKFKEQSAVRIPEEPIEIADKATAILPPAKKMLPVLTTSIQQEPGEKTADLLIPKIGQKYSVYWGADEKTLEKGVGLYVSDLTTVPGGNGHTVLSGHRDTVFTGLGELEEKDELMIEYDGETFVYEITHIWITHEDDRTVIVEKDQSTLTLTTCYPFDFFGYAPDRYIVQAELLSTHETTLK
ncbi:class D sortase [Planococcus antarcticus DSM 14505]|uniref:Class D sortase n=1 Tax=Planococcus antarcticus DSM 14505 TaxID=1185653 RepID=A0ABM6D891_9BACL|nr:class D sortase [Planococcus antarcticus]ANU11789.1 class D sortase [Planococcus antarcticus DSM 14505]